MLTNKQLREIIEVEGDIYSAMQAIVGSQIEDPTVRGLWFTAKSAMEDLEDAIYEDA